MKVRWIVALASLWIAVLGKGSAALAADAKQQMLMACETNVMMVSVFDCGCVADQFDAAYTPGGKQAPSDVFNQIFREETIRACIDKAKLWTSAARQCLEGMRFGAAVDRMRLGSVAFCQCAADDAVARAATEPLNALNSLPAFLRHSTQPCAQVASYPVPPDSPLLPKGAPKIPELPPAQPVSSSPSQKYLMVINDSFELAWIDKSGYALSHGGEVPTGQLYCTPNDAPVTAIPAGLLKLGAKPEQIAEVGRTGESTIVDAASMYKSAILLDGRKLAYVLGKARTNKQVMSITLYTFVGDTIYHVPDSRLP